jgi:hypothetical protein
MADPSISSAAVAHDPHIMFICQMKGVGGSHRLIRMTPESEAFLERILPPPTKFPGNPFVSIKQRDPEVYTVQYNLDAEEIPRSSLLGQWWTSVLDSIIDPNPKRECISNVFVSRAIILYTDAYVSFEIDNTREWEVPEDYQGILYY